MMEQKILNILKETFELESVDRTCSQNNCPAWDSMGQLNLVAELEEAFDISLEPWGGKEVTIELVNEPTDWYNEAALWKDIRLTAQGQEHL